MKRQATQVRVPQPLHSTTRQRREQIARLCAVIAQEFQPEKIILFGSWAYVKPDAESDIDLLVVMPFEGSSLRQAGTMLNCVIQSVGVLPLALLLRTSEQLGVTGRPQKSHAAIGNSISSSVLSGSTSARDEYKRRVSCAIRYFMKVSQSPLR